MSKARASKLAELKALRESGTTRLNSYKVQEDSEIYEEVDEESYKKVVRARLDQDDFVVDDNNAGYADDGREEWMDERGYSSSEGEQLLVKSKAAKRKREEEKEKLEKTNKNINNYFTNGPAAAVSKPKAKPAATAEDNAWMAGLLGEMDSNAVSTRPKTSKALKTENRRKVRVLSPPIERAPKSRAEKKTELHLPSTPISGDDDTMLPPLDNDEIMSDPIPSSPMVKAAERKENTAIKAEEEEEEDIMEISQAVGGNSIKAESVNISGARPIKKILKKSSLPTPESSSPTKPSSDAIDATAWTDVTAKLNVLSSPTQSTIGKTKVEDAMEEDGSIRFFWTDYTEINGSLCLFGKAKDKKSGTYVSSFVKVDNVLRKLFFLPREHKQKNGRETDEEVDMGDVYEEVDGLMSKLRVNMHKIKPCTRKYAFELPNVPKEAEYLKLMYPYDKLALSMDLQGSTFSNVFGTNTALFEQFVLWKNIMGPCWLQIDAENFCQLNNASWCKLEIECTSPKSITPLETDVLDAPPLTVMSMAFRTTMNVKENKQEILIASARVYENLSLNDTTPTDKLPCKTFTIMRPLEASYPVGFEALCKKQVGQIMLEKSEQMLLSKFVAMLEKIDPDVLMGHNLQDVDYPVLLSRMRDRKTPGWHRIGRFRRSDWPKNMGKGGNSFFAERQLVSGRLLCDIGNDMGKSLMTKCQSWSISEMCSLYLGSEVKRQELDNDIALKTWASSREGLLNYLKHCEADTYFIAALALRIQMLPLSKVLTNLAGNSWARTLTGTRAERNEYILLHEFHRNKYICPDKIWGKKHAKVEEPTEAGEDGVDVKKKDKFKGGLVFEPEKGLYDKFILVMDFNSLYPSIIQEYNICFTTVDRSDLGDDDEKVPEVPEETDLGILPKLIATLVSRRREVKKLMKDKRATNEQLATWDIKQMALKLTANSMYGCLGYVQSRFYARPLAMLTTFKGREILRSTKDLAENTQLRVVYGDTDSVMINTNVDSVEEALKVGNEFKKAVNEHYKLLEIDIDNVFRRLLLHAKKKYAAINLLDIDGKWVEKLEVKGLDMRRREYCALAKEASSSLLNYILSGEDPEVVLTKVHEYLRDLGERMREEKVPNQKYIIYTKLGKDPKTYPNPDSMPQVQVALRSIAQGKTVRVNDVVSFITTAVKEKSSDSAAKRAYTPMDVQKSNGELKPDVDWYLAKQIFPPIERLCAPIEGTDAGQLAESLGLDPKKYALGVTSRGEAGFDISPLESQLPDSVRFKDCPRLELTCTGCKHSFQFNGLAESSAAITPKGVVCPSESCGKLFRPLTLVAQVEHAVRRLTSGYYDAWLVCDDPSCGNRTRSLSVYGHRCLGPNGLAKDCKGRMGYEMTGKKVGSTLAYWKGLWDVDREKVAIKGEEGEKIKALKEWNRERFDTVKKVLEGYEKKCGWVWVQMDSLFGFALK